MFQAWTIMMFKAWIVMNPEGRKEWAEFVVLLGTCNLNPPHDLNPNPLGIHRCPGFKEIESRDCMESMDSMQSIDFMDYIASMDSMGSWNP